jgi:NAD dependent epimerase/dehydratase family enzyme
MKMKKDLSHNILFLGYGYVAQYFCKYYNSYSFNLGASINTSKEKYFKTSNEVTTIDFSEIDDFTLDNYNNFVISIPPFYQLKTDAIIDKFHDYFFNRKTPYKLIYLSATSVYGDHDGKKVQEDSKLKAESINGLARIACENKYLQLQENELTNIIVLRLAGIYGDKRNSILSIHSQEIICNKLSKRMISRAHVADITAIIREIILSSKIKNQIFNVSDNNPCPTNDVNDYICEELLKIDKLPINDDIKESRHSSFALDNKIVDNGKLKKMLNYEFIFPSYKEGIKKIAKNLNLI